MELFRDAYRDVDCRKKAGPQTVCPAQKRGKACCQAHWGFIRFAHDRFVRTHGSPIICISSKRKHNTLALDGLRTNRTRLSIQGRTSDSGQNPLPSCPDSVQRRGTWSKRSSARGIPFDPDLLVRDRATVSLGEVRRQDWGAPLSNCAYRSRVRRRRTMRSAMVRLPQREMFIE
jgi:hypothetical protein